MTSTDKKLGQWDIHHQHRRLGEKKVRREIESEEEWQNKYSMSKKRWMLVTERRWQAVDDLVKRTDCWMERTSVWIERTDRVPWWVGAAMGGGEDADGWVRQRGRVCGLRGWTGWVGGWAHGWRRGRVGLLPAGIDRGRLHQHHHPQSNSTHHSRPTSSSCSCSDEKTCSDDIEVGAGGQEVLTVVTPNPICARHRNWIL